MPTVICSIILLLSYLLREPWFIFDFGSFSPPYGNAMWAETDFCDDRRRTNQTKFHNPVCVCVCVCVCACVCACVCVCMCIDGWQSCSSLSDRVRPLWAEQRCCSKMNKALCNLTATGWAQLSCSTPEYWWINRLVFSGDVRWHTVRWLCSVENKYCAILSHSQIRK